MIECDDRQCRIAGAITVDRVGKILQVLKLHLVGKITELDFSRVDTVDSSVLALIFSCLRDAQGQGRSLHLTGLPTSVMTLADLYGVASLLPA
jgi:phospholipid transport system transporter-binding protein